MFPTGLSVSFELLQKLHSLVRLMSTGNRVALRCMEYRPRTSSHQRSMQLTLDTAVFTRFNSIQSWDSKDSIGYASLRNCGIGIAGMMGRWSGFALERATGGMVNASWVSKLASGKYGGRDFQRWWRSVRRWGYHAKPGLKRTRGGAMSRSALLI